MSGFVERAIRCLSGLEGLTHEGLQAEIAALDAELRALEARRAGAVARLSTVEEDQVRVEAWRDEVRLRLKHQPGRSPYVWAAARGIPLEVVAQVIAEGGARAP